MRIKTAMFSVVITVTMLGGIIISDLMGLWVTESGKEPARYTTGVNAGHYNPADIRGSYSFEDISKAFKIPVEELGTAFGVKENAAAFQCKDLEAAYADAAAAGYEIGTDSVRMFVALYLGLPYQPEAAYLPVSAAALLREKVSFSDEQLKYLEAHTYSANTTSSEVPIAVQPRPQEPQPSPSAEHNTSPEERLIKGKTTFREMLDWGVSREEIQSVLGRHFDVEVMTIRDFCSREGIEFSGIKEQLQAILDQK